MHYQPIKSVRIQIRGYHKVRFFKENKKVKKALHLMKQGQDLRIIHEKEYLKLLEGRKECL